MMKPRRGLHDILRQVTHTNGHRVLSALQGHTPLVTLSASIGTCLPCACMHVMQVVSCMHACMQVACLFEVIHGQREAHGEHEEAQSVGEQVTFEPEQCGGPADAHSCTQAHLKQEEHASVMQYHHKRTKG